MDWLAWYMVMTLGSIPIIVNKPQTVNTDCKDAKWYGEMYAYCTKGTIPKGFPQEFIGKECDPTAVTTLGRQVNLCRNQALPTKKE